MSKRVEVPLTGTLAKALPSLEAHLKLFTQLQDVLPALSRDLAKAERSGAVQTARAFVALYLLKTHLDNTTKAFDAIYQEMKETRVPAIFELEGVPNVPLDEGYRVGTSETMYVSIKEGMRSVAMDWLRKQAATTKDGGALADLIIETINSSTLSAAGRHMLAEEGRDLPGEIFESTFVPTTSVNKLKRK